MLDEAPGVLIQRRQLFLHDQIGRGWDDPSQVLFGVDHAVKASWIHDGSFPLPIPRLEGQLITSARMESFPLDLFGFPGPQGPRLFQGLRQRETVTRRYVAGTEVRSLAPDLF